jgi:hypothetical protein
VPDEDAALEGESRGLCVPSGVPEGSADLDGVVSALNDAALEAESLPDAVFAVDGDAESDASTLGVDDELLENVTIEEIEESALVLGPAVSDAAVVAEVVSVALFDPGEVDVAKADAEELAVEDAVYDDDSDCTTVNEGFAVSDG